MRIALTTTLLLFTLATSAFAQSRAKAVELPNTNYWEFTSKITNRPYAVYVALPDSYSTDAARQYPVLYASDGHIGFPLATSMYRLLRLTNDVPEMIIVGVAGTDPTAWAALRFEDLTPTRVPVREAEFAKTAGRPVRTGDAGNFIRVVGEELIPDIEGRYRTTKQRGFAGHSLGALFGVYAMLAAPELFQGLILVSPALQWDDQVMLSLESKFAEQKSALPATVFFAVGALESPAMLENLQRFRTALESRNYKGLAVHYRRFEEATHVSVFPGAFALGLRTLFAKQLPLK